MSDAPPIDLRDLQRLDPRSAGLQRAAWAEDLIKRYETDVECGRIPDPLLDRLWEIGVFTSFVPRECGGQEMDPIEWLSMTEGLSAVNGSIGWMAMNNCGFFMNYLQPEVFETMKDDRGRYIHALQVGRWGGQARRVEGGYRITGRWPFMSGSQVATYLGAASVLLDESNEVVIHPDGLPWLILAQWPAEQATLIDTWDGLGLRGTGSVDMVVDDLFVPDKLVNELGFSGLTYDRPMFRIRWLPLHAHGAHAIGLAQAALDEFVRLMGERAAPGSIRKMQMGNQQVHFVNFAKADAMVRAARHFLHQSTREAMAAAELDSDIDLEYKVLMRESMIYAVQASKEAVDLVFHMAGSSAVFHGRALERIYRDMVTAWNHVVNVETEYTAVGSYYITRTMPDGPHVVGRKFV